MSEATTYLGPLLGVLLGVLLTNAGASRSWWRDKRAEAYADALTQVEALRHRVDELTEPSVAFHVMVEMDSEDIVRMLKPLRAAQAIALLYAGRRVRSAMADFVTVLQNMAGSQPIDLPFSAVSMAADDVGRAMQLELRSGLRDWSRFGK